MHPSWLISTVICFALVKLCPSKSLKPKPETPKRECPHPVLNKNISDLPIDNLRDFHRGIIEVKFNGAFGKLESKRYCKLKCINGEWVGPLCLTDGGTPSTSGSNEGRFYPVFRSCTSEIFLDKFILTFRNKTIMDIQEFSHNAVVQVRCKQFGIYKLIGDAHLTCHNGVWKNRLPACIRTSSLTNYTDESAPPTVLATVTAGSASIEPTGELAVYPGSTVHLECLYLRTAGVPEWSWTSTYRPYPTGWAISPEERDWKYRLSIYYIKPQDTGIYTCATPKGITNSIILNVIAVHCDASKVISTDPNLLTQVQGSRLGQVTIFQCREGFKLNGTENMTCQASGVWSSYSPGCIPIVCPLLEVTDANVKMIKQDPGYGGTAVFQCPFGYKLIGVSTLLCLGKGTWSGSVPTCKEILCTPPLIPPNGKLEYGNESASFPFRVGSVLTFSCKGIYQLVGESSIVCQESGFWSNPPPFCKTKCPHPGDPLNGRFTPHKTDYEVGERISLTCSNGYEPSTKSKPKCQKHGIWSEVGMECKFKKGVKKLTEFDEAIHIALTQPQFTIPTTTTTTTTSAPVTISKTPAMTQPASTMHSILTSPSSTKIITRSSIILSEEMKNDSIAIARDASPTTNPVEFNITDETTPNQLNVSDAYYYVMDEDFQN